MPRRSRVTSVMASPDSSRACKVPEPFLQIAPPCGIELVGLRGVGTAKCDAQDGVAARRDELDVGVRIARCGEAKCGGVFGANVHVALALFAEREPLGPRAKRKR